MSPVTDSNPRASVIVCTHNPRVPYLNAALDALRRQSWSVRDWELLIIDNASTEPVSGWLDLSWHPQARVLRENELGLTHARLRGIRESRADLLVFVDDDNVLAPNYLEAALELAKSRPQLGIWSGRIELEFEMTPPEWTRKYWTFLVERPIERDATSQEIRLEEPLPVGAGMCVRREVALAYLNEARNSELRTSLDRRGVSLGSSGDTDMAILACACGWQRGVFTALRLRHLIPPERLSEDYLIRLLEGIQFSVFVVKQLHGINAAPPPINGWWHLKYFCDLATKFGRKRRFFQAAKRAQRRSRKLYEELELAKLSAAFDAATGSRGAS
ncbi:MAG TPA: glycosyltransferase [Verrucomicrobiae bacterium]|nr:glycosyltransferase [Verrucomicrobiae bacterium]